MRSAAVLYPGEMGCAVARVLVAAGWSVTTHLWGPSLVCRADAEAAGIADLASLDEAVGTCELVVSLVPPAVALETAEAVAGAARRSGPPPLYLDANTVAPATMTAIAATLAGAGLDCVDGAFVGSAAELAGRTRLYLSGPRAGELAAALPEALHATALGVETGAASALKLAFAGFNKGLVALFIEVVAAAGAARRARRAARLSAGLLPGHGQDSRPPPAELSAACCAPRRRARRACAWLSCEGGDAACGDRGPRRAAARRRPGASTARASGPAPRCWPRLRSAPDGTGRATTKP